jgi:isocitrate/isopropylmalate dehydrogenase
VDVVIVREATEGSYTGIEFEQGTQEAGELIRFIERTTGTQIREDSGLSIKAISVGASERIARFAFAHAKALGRRKVTAGHKANIMKFTDGLFLETVRRIALEYPEVSFEERIIDNLAMQLVQRPQDFDVLLLPNLYGDIISDLCAQMVGGLGFGCSGNIGEKLAVFEPAHGSAPKYAGQYKVNPIATILAVKMMLDWLGETAKGVALEAAVAKVIRDGKVRTYDMGGSSTTLEMGEAVAAAL